ncbi:MAG: FMN-binding negative transcriptional regulator [Aurantibacter sp.]
MYIPSHYKNENISEVKEFLARNSFGVLISTLEGKPWATHIPLELDVDKDGKDILLGHIAKANPQWKSFKNHLEVLCIFNGPHSYVSSSWYKEEEVPTWNYIAIHIYGKLKIIDGEELRLHLRKLVDKYEKASENPIKMENLSKNTMKQIRGVVGFQIEINEIQAAYKLSQGREHDRPKIVEELNKTGAFGSKAIAEEMNKRR